MEKKKHKYILSFGGRLKYFRLLRGLTQKELGMAVGFPEGSADVRIAQYEQDLRTPRKDVLCQLAEVLRVSIFHLDVPTIKDEVDVLKVLFALEDFYGLRYLYSDDHIAYVRLNCAGFKNYSAVSLIAGCSRLQEKLDEKHITREQYDKYRYENLQAYGKEQEEKS